MVRGKFWIKTILAAAISAAAPGQSLPAQPAPPAPPANVDPIQQAIAVLVDPRASLDQREDAAAKLVARRTNQSRDTVAMILADSRIPQSQVAVARALADNPDPDEKFRNPLFAMLQGPTQSGMAAAQALGTFKDRPDIVNQLANLANDRRNESGRLAAIDALGRLIDKTAAGNLMQLVSAPDEPQSIRNAAADALENLAGQPHIGRDVQGWQQWWTANATKPPQQFHADLMIQRGQQYDALERRLKDLESNFRQHLSDVYSSITDREQRAAKLLEYLRSNDPVVRGEGAQLVGQDKSEGNPVPPAAQQRLRQMIGDPDPHVRREVAKALIALNDREALAPLLDQVRRESDLTVRAELAKALGPIGDPSAIQVLLELLQDKSVMVAAAAADSLGNRELVPKLKSDPDKSRQAADALKNAFERTGDPATQGLREATIAALAELGDPRMLDILHGALNDRESPRVKQAAVTGIGNIHDPKTADWIAPYVDDQDVGVRRAAVQALGDVSGTVFAPRLMDLLKPKAAPAELQDEAWVVLQSFLRELDIAQLQKFAFDFGQYKDWKKRIRALEEVAAKQREAKNEDDRADTEQQIGETMMQDGQFEEAAKRFNEALDQKSKNPNVPPQAIITLVNQTMEALLKAAKFDDAMIFASTWMTRDKSYIREMGRNIKNEAERLRDESNENTTMLENSIKLIDLANNLKPPIDVDQLDQLKQIQDEDRKILEKIKGGTYVAPDPIHLNPADTATAERAE